MLQFPTVYIHIWKNAEDYEVYIGESNNIIQRTRQHYDSMSDETKMAASIDGAYGDVIYSGA